MIHYVTGNLLAASAEALINTVNTVGVINKRVKRAAFSQANCW